MRDRIFKGATRPAMKLGVPLVPLVVTFMVCFLCGMWGAFIFKSVLPALLFLTVLIALVVTMRSMTKHDDQRLRQFGMRIMLRLGNANIKFWGAVSYSPTRYKKR